MSSRGWSTARLARNDARFVETARTLTESEWSAPSLCEGWSNLDVLAHLVIGCSASMLAVGVSMARQGSFDRANSAMAKDLSGRHEAHDLVAIYETASQRRRGIGRLFPKNLLLGDHVIHELDIMLALGRTPTIEDDIIRAVLQTETTIANPFVPAKRTAGGLNLIASDLEWRSRRYPGALEVNGPGWALASVLANRPKALDQLQGPGVATLAQRLADNGHAPPTTDRPTSPS